MCISSSLRLTFSTQCLFFSCFFSKSKDLPSASDTSESILVTVKRDTLCVQRGTLAEVTCLGHTGVLG